MLDREPYRLLQLSLAAHPESGALMRGSGGLRQIRMLMAYAKTEAADLTKDRVKILRRVVEEEFR